MRAAALAYPMLALWQDATSSTIGTTAEWTHKVELYDVDRDGDVDLLFPNGGDYDAPGTPEPVRLFVNDGAGAFTGSDFGGVMDLVRVVKAGDVSGDGWPDLVWGGVYGRRPRLWLGGPGAAFTEVTEASMPDVLLSVGDLELGDVDGDGDLDVVLADWGEGNPLTNGGARPRLFRNDGAGGFTDDTVTALPDVRIGMSWDLEVVDVDGDFDLDVLVSCKACEGGFLFVNDGAGAFEDASSRLPQFGNDYEFEAMFVDGDDALDLVTINDGPGLREHLFRGDGAGGFADATAELWPAAANVGEDDNVAVFVDHDADGDADFLIGSLSGSDRLLVNDGSGHLSLVEGVLAGGAPTPGTLGLGVADLDGDHRPDVVMAQGEQAFAERVYLGADVVADGAPPRIAQVRAVAGPGTVFARVTDRVSPCRPHQFQAVELDAGGAPLPMTWIGEMLWRAELPAGVTSYRVCATDAAGNQACSPEVGPGAPDAGGSDATAADGGTGAGGDGGGCGCRVGSRASASLAPLVAVAVALAALLTRRRRRRSRPSPRCRTSS